MIFQESVTYKKKCNSLNILQAVVQLLEYISLFTQGLIFTNKSKKWNAELLPRRRGINIEPINLVVTVLLTL